MVLIMLQLRDLPTKEILKKFEQRYPEVDIASVLIFLRFLRVGSDLSTALDGFLLKHGLLQGRWWVLILLMREENQTSIPSVLAEKSGVSRATMTRLLDGLERDGLIKRRFDQADRRSFSVSLTPSGQKKLDEVMPDYYQRVNQSMAKLGAKDYQKLNQILELIQAGSGAFE